MRKESLEQSLYAENPEALEKLQKLREVELEKQSILSEICNRYVVYSTKASMLICTEKFYFLFLFFSLSLLYL